VLGGACGAGLRVSDMYTVSWVECLGCQTHGLGSYFVACSSGLMVNGSKSRV